MQQPDLGFLNAFAALDTAALIAAMRALLNLAAPLLLDELNQGVAHGTVAAIVRRQQPGAPAPAPAIEAAVDGAGADGR